MRLLTPLSPPYDGLEWEKLPFPERARLVCEAWCMQGYGSPVAVYLGYVLKVAAYVGLWFFFCGFTEGMDSISTVGSWWLEPIALYKALLLVTALEGLGIAGSSGPLTGRYFPPFGGFLYFLRPGTTKLALFPKLPLLGGTRRTIVDVAIYASVLALIGFALTRPAIPPGIFVALAVLVPLMGLADKTLFLAFRGEFYWPMIVCIAALDPWVAGVKAVLLATWFWAGFSKLNHHFPTVVAVMTSNHPIVTAGWMRRLMYRDFPSDVRPSKLCTLLAHGGTLLEFAVPAVLAFATGGWPLTVGLALMVMLHAYIFSNMPMAVPLEWNVVAAYAGFATFGAHPEIPFWAVGSVPVALLLVACLVAVPLIGNLRPDRVSFLASMRYYAGNWPYNIWLFRGETHKKLEALTKSSAWIFDQLEVLYDPSTCRAIGSKVMGFRLMHLQGRALSELIPKAVGRLEDYTYMDGEIIAGIVLGWNFGDGHLNNERLLHAVQEQCGFEEGELRLICVEAQPLGGRGLDWRIYDAVSGLRDSGTLQVSALRQRQPWEGPQG